MPYNVFARVLLVLLRLTRGATSPVTADVGVSRFAIVVISAKPISYRPQLDASLRDTLASHSLHATG